MKRKCTHLRAYDGAVGRWCLDCEERLPLGPAKDTPAVAVELRAAELSDLASSHADHMESAGWSAWTYDGAPLRDDRWHAGWLGKAIFEHDREQRFVCEDDLRAAASEFLGGIGEEVAP